MKSATILWKRLDVEGHDCCRLHHCAQGWRVEGATVFLHERQPACLRYEFSCDAGWRTLQAYVSGWVGETPIDLRIGRSDTGAWLLNGVEQPISRELIDLDLGFTPATNILPIRRLALAVEEERPAPTAYLAFPELKLDTLEQTYRRIDSVRYAYSAPRFGYEAILTVSDIGFVTSYPQLWEAAGVLTPPRGR